jgi:transketolase
MAYSNVRDIYFETIYDLIKQGEDIVVVSADLAAPSLDIFRKDFGNRFINVGIAEQNLITVACGLALSGKKAIAYGLNPFPITRAFDQIRNTVSSMNIPITIAALNAGLCSAESGATHLAVEDVCLMRTLPRIKTVNISDQIIAKKAAYNSAFSSQPSYIRFDKQISCQLYDQNEIDFNLGFTVHGNGRDVAIITTGYQVGLFKDQINKFIDRGLNVTLIDCYALPLDETKLLEVLKNVKVIVTVEENCLAGSLGSMILEILSDNEILKPVKRFGINFQNGYPSNFGDREYFLNNLGLDINYILEETYKYCMKFDL